MAEHFNQLTPKQTELLTLLAEECAEVIQAVAKIQRHGLHSSHPASSEPNRGSLQRELGDVAAAIKLLIDIDLVDRKVIDWYRDHKLNHVGKYLHHAGDER
jgi:NTP pyrophosphatase (non-canonical NTP hydrolase)